jgi:hypothetical protein
MTNNRLNNILSFLHASKETLRKLKLEIGLKMGLAGLLLLIIGFNLKSLSGGK